MGYHRTRRTGRLTLATDPTVTVLAPSVFVTITIEDGPSESAQEIHLHAGGQGMWIARMLHTLGERPVVCAPVGGESGRALDGLAREWDVVLDTVTTEAASPVYVHDRRDGQRQEVARSEMPALDRHEVDELYGRVLRRALDTGVCVVTGRVTDHDVPIDVYRRLGADLADAGVQVVGDLHGEPLGAYLDTGTLRWLKVSDGDLREDGLIPEDDDAETAAWAAVDQLVDRGAEAVLLSQGGEPALARAGGRRLRVTGPAPEVVDPRGSGDSMTAALAVAVRGDLDPEQALRLAWGAGAANVTRHGHGSASAELIESLATRVTVEPLEDP